jgi:alpha-glucosidase
VTFNGHALDGGWTYNATSKVLLVTGLAYLTRSGAWSQDWILAWGGGGA